MAKTSLKKFVHFKDLILFEDDDILVANKPLYMASLEDKEMRNLQGMGKNYHPELRLCHRLDKMTSGVILFAKGAENYRNIALQFQNRTVRKHYKTLIKGIHRFNGYTIDRPLYVSSNKKVTVNYNSGKQAVTVVTVEKTYLNFSLLSCEPVTGRMHQIRVHLASVGCPIVGDRLYGGADIYLSNLKKNYKPSMRKEEQPLNHGYLLHAYSLKFSHPKTGEEMQVEAPIPKNFSVVLKMLDKYNG